MKSLIFLLVLLLCVVGAVSYIKDAWSPPDAVASETTQASADQSIEQNAATFSFASRPEAIKSQLKVSSQTLWPAARSA